MNFTIITPNVKTPIEAKDWTGAEKMAKTMAWLIRSSVTVVNGDSAIFVPCPKANPNS